MSLFQSAADDLPSLESGFKNARAMSIDSVALLFQSILQEDRLEPSIRVWLARLQMPLIRHALAQPTMFGSESHPSIDLVTHIVSCLLGLENHTAPAELLEKEIHRLVVVVETKQVGGLATWTQAHAEFKAFLAQHQKLDAVPQPPTDADRERIQIDLFTMHYKILLRNLIYGTKARPEFMEFLFKIWAEVLAIATVRYGHEGPRTLELKQTVTALIWATGAKQTRRNRARAIKDAPGLIHNLRNGLDLLGLPQDENMNHINALSAQMMDAFVDKKSFVRNRPTLFEDLPGLEVTEEYSSSGGWHLWESAQAEQKDSPTPVNSQKLT